MRLSDEQKIEIVQKYKTGNYTYADLGKEYCRDSSCISRMVRKRGVETKYDAFNDNRKYSVDYNYFNIIDTEDKAYFLGLLMADGYNNEERGFIKIELQESDKHIIEEFNKYISSNNKLFYIERSKDNPKWKNMWKLVIYSRFLSNSLAKLGCVQAKSLILEFPSEEQVPKDLWRPFILGYFDGDGSFGRYIVREKYLDYRFSLMSTKNFCNKVKDIFEEKTGVNCRVGTNRKNETKTTRKLQTGGKFQVKKILDWLYKNSTIKLERKYQKYLDEFYKE